MSSAGDYRYARYHVLYLLFSLDLDPPDIYSNPIFRMSSTPSFWQGVADLLDLHDPPNPS
ncbi:MAG: hypothetical protein GY906_24520 [bacterium]|nr:hypothetical protein [bacterium]